MRQFKGMFVVAALAAAATFVACGETEETPPGSTTCVADSDCAEGEGCHPSAKVCLKTCTQTSDCADDQTQANCGPVKNADGTDSTTKFCKCSTDQLCNADDTTDLICSNISNACSEKCTTNADCSNFGAGATCDTATGQCELQATPTTCTKDEECTDATKPFCDTATGACVATQPIPKCDPTKTAPGANGGPDICKAGEYCNASQECVPAKGTCEAATKFATAPTAASPTVFNVQIDSAANRTGAPNCTGGNVTAFKASWYDPEGDVNTTGTYSKINRVSKAGVKAPTYEKTSITKNADGKSGTLTFELCDDQKGNAQGVIVTDQASNTSNVACYTF